MEERLAYDFAGMWNAMSKPKCSSCGKLSDVHAAPRPGMISGTYSGYRWIGATCEYLEGRPDARRITEPARDVLQLPLADGFPGR